jgi:nucleoside-diphosphate-sugar epimerase
MVWSVRSSTRANERTECSYRLVILRLFENGAVAMPENALLTGLLEPAIILYVATGIAAIKQCETYGKQHSADFSSVMATNICGLGDNTDPENGYRPPALIRLNQQAKPANSPVP